MSRYSKTKRGEALKSKDFLHISAPIVHIVDPATGLRKAVSGKGKSYRNPKLSAFFNTAKLSDRERRIYNKRMKRKGTA